jgi:hypothetical protein
MQLIRKRALCLLLLADGEGQGRELVRGLQLVALYALIAIVFFFYK